MKHRQENNAKTKNRDQGWKDPQQCASFSTFISNFCLVVWDNVFFFFVGSIGTVISGYRVRNGVWTLIGKGDPQRPQVNNNVCLM